MKTKTVYPRCVRCGLSYAASFNQRKEVAEQWQYVYAPELKVDGLVCPSCLSGLKSKENQNGDTK